MSPRETREILAVSGGNAVGARGSHGAAIRRVCSGTQSRLSRSRGFITAEVILWLTLLLIVFGMVFRLAAQAWIQLRVEDAAWSIAQWAYQHPEAQEPPGSGQLTTPLFEGRGTAQIVWTEEHVIVRVEAEGGSQATERRFPMEMP